MSDHEAPTNRRCPWRAPSPGRRRRCVRHEGHPADLYGTLGHRLVIDSPWTGRHRRIAQDEDYAYVCTRADLSGGRR